MGISPRPASRCGRGPDDQADHGRWRTRTYVPSLREFYRNLWRFLSVLLPQLPLEGRRIPDTEWITRIGGNLPWQGSVRSSYTLTLRHLRWTCMRRISPPYLRNQRCVLDAVDRTVSRSLVLRVGEPAGGLGRPFDTGAPSAACETMLAIRLAEARCLSGTESLRTSSPDTARPARPGRVSGRGEPPHTASSPAPGRHAAAILAADNAFQLAIGRAPGGSGRTRRGRESSASSPTPRSSI